MHGRVSAQAVLPAIKPLEWKGSGDLFTLAAANALLDRAANEPPLPDTLVRAVQKTSSGRVTYRAIRGIWSLSKPFDRRARLRSGGGIGLQTKVAEHAGDGITREETLGTDDHTSDHDGIPRAQHHRHVDAFLDLGPEAAVALELRHERRDEREP
jgi:hypothetical protein